MESRPYADPTRSEYLLLHPWSAPLVADECISTRLLTGAGCLARLHLLGHTIGEQSKSNRELEDGGWVSLLHSPAALQSRISTWRISNGWWFCQSQCTRHYGKKKGSSQRQPQRRQGWCSPGWPSRLPSQPSRCHGGITQTQSQVRYRKDS